MTSFHNHVFLLLCTTGTDAILKEAVPMLNTDIQCLISLKMPVGALRRGICREVVVVHRYIRLG